MSNSLQTGFPRLPAKLTDREGNISSVWYLFLVQLWQRTGGSIGISTEAVDASTRQFAFDDDQPSTADQVFRQLMLGENDDGTSDSGFIDFMLDGDVGLAHGGSDRVLIFDDGLVDRQPLLHPGFASGQFYSTWPGNVSATGTVSAADRVFLYPFQVPKALRAGSFAIRVATPGTSSAAKFGLWANVNGRPAGLPVSADNVGVATTLAGVVTFSAPDVNFRGGEWCWIGTKHSGTTTPVCLSIPGNALLSSYLAGADTASNALQSGATNQLSALSFIDAYANPMPDLTGAALAAVTGASQGVPIITFQAA